MKISVNPLKNLAYISSQIQRTFFTDWHYKEFKKWIKKKRTLKKPWVQFKWHLLHWKAHNDWFKAENLLQNGSQFQIQPIWRIYNYSVFQESRELNILTVSSWRETNEMAICLSFLSENLFLKMQFIQWQHSLYELADTHLFE